MGQALYFMKKNTVSLVQCWVGLCRIATSAKRVHENRLALSARENYLSSLGPCARVTLIPVKPRIAVISIIQRAMSQIIWRFPRPWTHGATVCVVSPICTPGKGCKHQDGQDHSFQRFHDHFTSTIKIINLF